MATKQTRKKQTARQRAIAQLEFELQNAPMKRRPVNPSGWNL
jgi:hypothetical protein